MSRTLARFVEHRLAAASALVFLALVLACAGAPLWSSHEPERTNLAAIFEPPSPLHPLGTDGLGRDLATRLLYGGRVSLAIGILVVAGSVSIGLVVGGIAGYYGRWVDGLLMRFVDVMYSFPRLFVLILLAVIFGGGLLTIVLALGALSWMTTARLVRSQFLTLRHRAFVEAARAMGAPDRTIMVRHILPNGAAPIIVAATLGVASAILTESTLSFLGLGIQPPTPTWGSMLREAQADLITAPWTAIFPGVAIFLAVVSINFIGDGLRDALDPLSGHRAR